MYDIYSAREIQAQEGLIPMWGPPASGGSTPLREAIPESPSQDGFPDFVPPSETIAQSPARRVRAGTVPSKFSPGGHAPGTSSPVSLPSKSSRPTPSPSPFRPSPVISEDASAGFALAQVPKSTLLSRLRAGSLPQRATAVENPSPFGSSLFSSSWFNGRERVSTLQSVRSSDAPESPAQSSFSKDGLNDADVKTLDYLGLAETPQHTSGGLTHSDLHRLSARPLLGELADLQRISNRFRSYSVNATEKYTQDGDEYRQGGQFSELHSGAMTPIEASTAAALAATQAQIHQHNLAVQAFANHASASRPRARTAGILDSPARMPGNYYLASPSRLESSMNAADYRILPGLDYAGLPEAVQALHLNGTAGRSNLDSSDETSQDAPTRALWLGNIPNSTTSTSLEAIFLPFGKIESSRVLSQKNCGFVNFELIESAVRAKSSLNGQEIFPGAGPIKIGYAKEPSTSVSGTASNNEAFQSRSPDPSAGGIGEGNSTQPSQVANSTASVNGVQVHASASGEPDGPHVSEISGELMQIVRQLGADSNEQICIATLLEDAIISREQEETVPPLSEPNHERVYDASKLREIRKRIDADSLRQQELEETAVSMLPEIAELSSDYLGNTVVQKLFERCSEAVKEAMLLRIAPHLAEIGIHKNGTWAAQKIIDKTGVTSQMRIIVDSLRPYSLGLFHDQYGNYVLQCCLRFGSPWSDFVYAAILSRMCNISQARIGSRAIRACLESPYVAKYQLRMISAAIVFYSVQLATNANGALLITWFLDASNLPRRRALLAPRLVPHLVFLCTHKVAFQTVLKVVNQRNEAEARDMIMNALFSPENDQTLESILSDQACGANFIYKLITFSFTSDKERADVIQPVRNMLSRLKVSPSQGYKRLMDEVGLSARAGRGERDHHNGSRPGSRQDRNRPVSQHGSSNGRRHQTEMMERQYSGHYNPPPTQQNFPVVPMSSAIEMNSLPAYDHFAPAFGTQFNQPYRPVLLNSATPGISPASFYPAITTAAGVNGYIAAPTLDPNFSGIQSSINQRPLPINMNPLISQAQFGTPPGFNPLMGPGVMAGTYQYPMQYLPQQQMMPQQSGGKRPRVGI